MAIPVDAAVESLRGSAREQAHDPRLDGRLEEISGVLAEDLEWIEAALADATRDGVSPGADAARHLVARGGKRVRPMSLLLAAACFGPVPGAAREMALVAELIHSATLLHDDVIDDGMERRGAPTARRVWGNAVSVLAGDLLLVEALRRTEQHAPEILPDLISTLRQLVDGEIVQLRGRAELDVSRATYDRILDGKTASLFRWTARTGARLAGASEADQNELASFGELIGMAFQLVDDVLDYASEETDKTPLADLREGKLTLPLVIAVERSPELAEPVKQIHGGDAGLVEDVHGRVLASGACDEVRERARDYTTRAVEVLRSVPSSGARLLLENVALQLAQRTR